MKEGKSYINPCEFHSVVYLCGQGSYLMEAFDPATCTFLDIKIALPDAELSLVFQENKQLVVLSGKYVTRWRSEKGNKMVQCYQALHSDIGVFCNMAPVVDEVNGLVYIVDMGVCYSVKVDGSERSEIAS